jgi:hypothetical protein
MVRLRSSSRASSHRAGSRDGAKQLCGLRLSRPLPGERTATMSHVASQKPLRAARRLIKTASSTPSQGNGIRQATHRGNRDPQRSGRLPAAASAQLVFGSACGPPQAGDGSTRSHVLPITGPRRGGQSKANGVGPVTQRAKGIHRDPLSHSLLACLSVRPGCPSSANSSPRRAGVLAVFGLRSVHGPPSPGL